MEAHANRDEMDLYKKAVISNAEMLSKFLIFCSILLLTITVIKLQGKTVFELGNLEIGIDKAWLAILALSIAHQVVAAYLTKSLYVVNKRCLYEERKKLLKEITTTGPLFFRGFIPRKLLHPGSTHYVLSPRDPTTWLYCFSSILILLAAVPFSSAASGTRIMEVVIGIYLLLWNWGIGSAWALQIGKLANEDEGLEARLRRHEFMRFNKIGMHADEIKEAVKLVFAAVGMMCFYGLGLVIVGIYFYLQ